MPKAHNAKKTQLQQVPPIKALPQLTYFPLTVHPQPTPVPFIVQQQVPRRVKETVAQVRRG